MRRVLFAALALTTPACFSAATECQNTLDCAQSQPVEAGADGDAADGGDAIAEGGEASTIGDGGTECEAGDEGCTAGDRLGVFASPIAAAGGDGSRARPFATIGAAISAAKGTGLRRIYACGDGAFDESIAIDASTDGLAIYGGFACSDWHVDPSLVARVSPKTPGVVLTVKALALGLVVQDVAFVAADATGAGASSIGAIVDASANVRFLRVSVHTGDGAAGANGGAGGNGGDGGGGAGGTGGASIAIAHEGSAPVTDASTTVVGGGGAHGNGGTVPPLGSGGAPAGGDGVAAAVYQVP